VHGGSGGELESVREDGQTVFQDAVLISADTLPQRTVQSDPFRLHLVGLPLGSEARYIFLLDRGCLRTTPHWWTATVCAKYIVLLLFVTF